MGNFRFYRRMHIFPGLSVNLSKSGPSLTVGVRGAHMTFGSQGVRRTVGIPGTGLYYTERSGHHTGIHSAHVDSPRSRYQTFVMWVAWLGIMAALLYVGCLLQEWQLRLLHHG